MRGHFAQPIFHIVDLARKTHDGTPVAMQQVRSMNLDIHQPTGGTLMENTALNKKDQTQELARHEQALERYCPHLWQTAARQDSQQAWSRAYDQLSALEIYLRHLAVVPAAEAVADLKAIAGIRAANADGKEKTAA